MDLVCPECKRTVHLKQKYPYHAGFSNEGFLYCDSCPTVLKFDSYNAEYVRLIGNKHPWTLSKTEQATVERCLKPCRCGGRFHFSAFPRCPFCGKDISSCLPGKIYFIEIGDVLDADKDENVWLCRNQDGKKPSSAREDRRPKK